MTPVMKYNPAFLSDQDLVGSFVVRDSVLAKVREILVECSASATNQHILLVAPRGFGKSTLLRRVAAAMRAEPELAGWHPIIYSEEAFEITSVASFWLEALFFLAQQGGGDEVMEAYKRLKREPDDERVRTLALTELRDFSERSGKRLMVAVENLQMLIDDSVLDSNDAWTLRHTLLNEPGILLLGTATTRLAAQEDVDHAFYELFLEIQLAPLTPAECAALFTHLAGEKVDLLRGRAIQILTGGNPRLLVILSEIVRGRPLHSLLQDFIRLIDEHTDYFKGNLESLPAAERRIFAALAELWIPATAAEVAAQGRLTVNNASALLARLEKRGAITSRAVSSRRKRYQVGERLYNIYYLLRRHGRSSQRVRLVIDFMAAYYDPDALATTALAVAESAIREDSHRHFYVDCFLSLWAHLDANRARVAIRLSNAFLELSEIPPDERQHLVDERSRQERAQEEGAGALGNFLDMRPFVAGVVRLLEDDPWLQEFRNRLARRGPGTSPRENMKGALEGVKDAVFRRRAGIQGVIARAKRAPDLGVVEALAMAFVALAIDRPRDFVRLLERSLAPFREDPWARLVEILVKGAVRNWPGDKLATQLVRLCDRFSYCEWLPVVCAMVLDMGGERSASQTLYLRVIDGAMIARLASALAEIHDDILEEEEAFVLSAQWRELAELAKDDLWEFVFVALFDLTTRLESDSVCREAVIAAALRALPSSGSLRVTLAMRALKGGGAVEAERYFREAAVRSVERWDQQVRLGVSLGWFLRDSASATRHLIESWRKYVAADLAKPKSVLGWLEPCRAVHPLMRRVHDVLARSSSLHDSISFLASGLVFESREPVGSVVLVWLALLVSVANGQEEHLVRVLEESPAAAGCMPIIAALRHYTGDALVLPQEVEEVSADIIAHVECVRAVAEVVKQTAYGERAG